jgi:type I restriction enzyme M protein
VERIRENDYALTPGRYVGIADPVKDAGEYQESLNSLTQELKNLMHENHRLERELEDKLGAIGYEIYRLP